MRRGTRARGGSVAGDAGPVGLAGGQPGWHRRVLAAGVIATVGVATGFAVAPYPGTVGDLGEIASSNSRLSFSDREIAGGNAVVVDQAAMYQARARIPPDAAYRVETGPGVEGAGALTSFVADYARYFLMPRRLSAEAPWVLCYGCDVAALGDAEVVWTNGAGISVVRLAA